MPLSSLPRLHPFLPFLAAALAGGCASYPEKIAPSLQNLRNGTPASVEQTVGASALNGRDRVLFLLEKGRMAQLQGRSEESRQALGEAVDAIVVPLEQEASGLAKGAGTAAAQTAAVFWNDTSIPYQPDVYESQMAIQFQLENYLLAADPAVRDKSINFVQRCYAQGKLFQGLREKMQRELGASRESSPTARRSLASLQGQPEWRQLVNASSVTAAKVKNSYDNAYCWYLAGLVYEMHPYDFAGSDRSCYEKAWRIFPENQFLQRDVYRTAKRDGLDALAEEVRQMNPEVAATPALEERPQDGDLVVVFQDGLVAQKQQTKLPVPLVTRGRLTSLGFIAFPSYDVGWRTPRPLQVYDGGAKLGATEPVCYVNSLAVMSLKEKLWPIVTRQVVRLVAKSAASIALTEAAYSNDRPELALLGGIGMGIFNYVSEDADLRGWYSLPENIQLFRTRLPAGRHVLKFDGGSGSATLAVDVRPGSRTFVQVARPGAAVLHVQAGAYDPGRPDPGPAAGTGPTTSATQRADDQPHQKGRTP